MKKFLSLVLIPLFVLHLLVPQLVMFLVQQEIIV